MTPGRKPAGVIKFKNPYQDKLADHIRACAARGLPMIQKGQHKDAKGAIVCGAGPSLLNFTVLQKVREKARQGWHIIACKEAIRLLREKHVRIDYSVSMDPRPEQVAKTHLDPSIVYCIASACHPALFDHVIGGGCRVQVFHNICGAKDPVTGETEFALYKRLFPSEIAVGWGSSVANRAFGVAHVMQFPRVWLAGVDFGWRAGKDYYARGGRAAPQDNGDDFCDDGKIDGRPWYSRADMLHSAVAMAEAARQGYVDKWLGDSLGKALIDKPDICKRILGKAGPQERAAA